MVPTGLMQVGLDWFRVVQESILARDLLFLDTVAPEQLRRIAKSYASEYNGTTTIYHFGVDPNREQMMGFAYRSTNDFASERLPTGFAIKPADEVRSRIEDLVQQHGLLGGLVEVMRPQKQRDDTLTPDTRVGIGGEVHLLTLDLTGRQCVWTAHQFPDFNDGYASALDRLRREMPPPNSKLPHE